MIPLQFDSAYMLWLNNCMLKGHHSCHKCIVFQKHTINSSFVHCDIIFCYQEIHQLICCFNILKNSLILKLLIGMKQIIFHCLKEIFLWILFIQNLNTPSRIVSTCFSILFHWKSLIKLKVMRLTRLHSWSTILTCDWTS